MPVMDSGNVIRARGCVARVVGVGAEEEEETAHMIASASGQEDVLEVFHLTHEIMCVSVKELSQFLRE